MASDAKCAIAEAIKKGIAPAMTVAGFRKYGMQFHRRVKTVVQVVAIHFSQESSSSARRFSLNIGIGFDKLWSLDQQQLPERPKEYQLHFNKRAQEIIRGLPQCFEASSMIDADALAVRLAIASNKLLAELDDLDSVDAFLRKGWLGNGADRILKARMHYVRGEFEKAIADLQSAAAFFSDRQSMDLKHLIQDHNMSQLAAHLPTD
jgi:hypothetical protein